MPRIGQGTEMDESRGRTEKYHSLVTSLQRYKRIAIAYSGGIDSTLLLRAAVDSGAAQIFALHGRSVLLSQRSSSLMKKSFAANFPHSVELIKLSFLPLRWDNFIQNDTRRCYICKKNLYTMLLPLAENLGAEILFDGTNGDDIKKGESGRPGLAALRELAVASPLSEYAFSKKEVRRQAAVLGLCNAYQPSDSCLATRIESGIVIRAEVLQFVEQAEALVYSILAEKGLSAANDGRIERLRVRLQHSGILIEIQERQLREKASGRTKRENETAIATKIETRSVQAAESALQHLAASFPLSLPFSNSRDFPAIEWRFLPPIMHEFVR